MTGLTVEAEIAGDERALRHLLTSLHPPVDVAG
jgi:hypothetical protein